MNIQPAMTTLMERIQCLRDVTSALEDAVDALVALEAQCVEQQSSSSDEPQP